MAVPNISSLPADVLRRVRFGIGRAGARRAAFSTPGNAEITQAQTGGSNPPLQTGPGFAGALLARKKFDLLSEQALANQALQLGNIGRNFVAAGRNLEGNLEGRGILKSGEAMRDRIALGGEEKAARAAVEQQTQDLINQYGLEYAYQLAQAQAAGATTPEEEVAPSPGGGGGSRPPSGGGSRPPSGGGSRPPSGGGSRPPSGGGSTPTVPGPFRPGVPAGVRDPQPIPNPPSPFRPGVPSGVRDPKPIPTRPKPKPTGGGAPGLTYR